MTKIGEGKTPPQPEDFKKEIEKRCHKLLRDLEIYRKAPSAERPRLRAAMDVEMGLIREAAAELTRFGVHKQDVRIEKGYNRFVTSSSEESYSALLHDISTLCEYCRKRL